DHRRGRGTGRPDPTPPPPAGDRRVRAAAGLGAGLLPGPRRDAAGAPAVRQPAPRWRGRRGRRGRRRRRGLRAGHPPGRHAAHRHLGPPADPAAVPAGRGAVAGRARAHHHAVAADRAAPGHRGRHGDGVRRRPDPGDGHRPGGPPRDRGQLLLRRAVPRHGIRPGRRPALLRGAGTGRRLRGGGRDRAARGAAAAVRAERPHRPGGRPGRPADQPGRAGPRHRARPGHPRDDRDERVPGAVRRRAGPGRLPGMDLPDVRRGRAGGPGARRPADRPDRRPAHRHVLLRVHRRRAGRLHRRPRRQLAVRLGRGLRDRDGAAVPRAARAHGEPGAGAGAGRGGVHVHDVLRPGGRGRRPAPRRGRRGRRLPVGVRRLRGVLAGRAGGAVDAGPRGRAGRAGA
ncbi:MAG: hypothetical protein AVDCRST_MAG41-3276, partial [uncultured Corynebacteriales bacterium]